ncbi:MAG TPA: TIM barrel protein [Acidimicrobiales bacterium]|nr:TIM barrel protein [Acidimicrobiales bacterium]
MLDVLRLTAASGFDAIGLDLPAVEASSSIGEVAAALRDAGLPCSDVLVLIAGADEHLAATARSLGRLASAVGAPACIAAVAAPVPRAELVGSLAECASILADHGCRLAVEFTPYSALPTLAEAKALCEAVGWDRCGLVLDPIHFFRSGAPWEELATVTADQIAVVQWDDVPAATPASLVEESRHRRVQPGDGGLDLARFAAAIGATGWDGVVAAEILSDDLRRTDPAVAIPATFAALSSPASGWRATSAAG